MSVWHTPHARRRTSTSPAPGSARSISWIASGEPNSSRTAARIFTPATLHAQRRRRALGAGGVGARARAGAERRPILWADLPVVEPEVEGLERDLARLGERRRAAIDQQRICDPDHVLGGDGRVVVRGCPADQQRAGAQVVAA